MWGDYNSSMMYFFDNEPSNFGPDGWNTDRHYMVEAPIEGIRVQIATSTGTEFVPKRSENP
jgi:hypothetical protein